MKNVNYLQNGRKIQLINCIIFFKVTFNSKINNVDGRTFKSLDTCQPSKSIFFPYRDLRRIKMQRLRLVSSLLTLDGVIASTSRNLIIPINMD